MSLYFIWVLLAEEPVNRYTDVTCSSFLQNNLTAGTFSAEKIMDAFTTGLITLCV